MIFWALGNTRIWSFFAHFTALIELCFLLTAKLGLMLDYSDMSVRKATARLNRLRQESGGMKATTYRNTVEREGVAIQEHIEGKCEEIIEKHGFSEAGELKEKIKFTLEVSQSMPIIAIGTAMTELNIKKAYVSDYENPESAVNISVDDVGATRQSETRPRGEKEQPKTVNNSVIHVENNEGKYILNSAKVFGVLKLLLGFLLSGGLLGKQLVFFTDGAREIHNEISRIFAFANYKIILDWYHLQKKCKRVANMNVVHVQLTPINKQLSLAMKGAKIRNAFLNELLPCLWFGNVDGAITLLQNINPNKIKEPEYITKLIDYFERVRDYIPCYILRKQLGLRNSSNLGEKSNDLIVSSRQKDNGTSWSDNGSHAFASVAAISCNNQLLNWVNSRSINFDWVRFDQAV